MSQYKPVRSRSSEKRPQDYKGAPFLLDRILFWMLRSLIQLPLFFLIYLMLIGYVQSRPDGIIRYFYEISFILVALLISDIIAYFVASMLDDYLIHKWGYLRNPKHRKTKLLILSEYAFYLIFRAMSYAFGFIWILSGFLYPTLHLWSFLFAWIIVSGTSKFLSMILSSALFTGF